VSLKVSNPMNAVVWLAFLTPGRFSGTRSDFALAAASFALGCLILWTKPAPWESRGPAREAAGFFGTLQFLSAIAWLYALAFKGAQTGPLDLLELPRWLLLGGFSAWLIRHHDESVRSTTETALAAGVYASPLLFPDPAGRAFYAALALAYLLLLSRSSLRLLHAAAAAGVLFTAGYAPSWSAPADALRLVRLSPALGWGPASYDIVSATGPQYLRWLARGGALGAAVMLAGFALLAYRLLRGEDDLRRRAALGTFLACAALLAAFGPWFDGYRNCFMAAFLLAAACSPRGGAA
jgi:hypothetical protein